MKHFICLITFLILSTICFSQIEIKSFEFEGLTREYQVFLPQNIQPNMPLVFVFHGYSETPEFIIDYTRMNEVADTAGFIAVYPKSIAPSWNCGVIAIPPLSPIDTTVHDVAFISALMDSLFVQYDIDSTRVYSCGFSMGGEMTYRLNSEIGHRFAAFASVAGLINDVSAEAYVPNIPKPILHFHGTDDNYEYYYGGWSNLWSVDSSLNFWLDIDECELTPDTVAIPDTDPDDGCTAEKISYLDCWGNTKIIFYKITNGGHSWPGSPLSPGWAGNVSGDIHASTLIWEFFKDYQLVIPIENPFGLPITNYAQGPRFADFDNDGDQDLLIAEIFGGNGGFHYYENVSTASEIIFAPGVDNPFGLGPIGSSAFPDIEDLDGDGDQDLMVGSDDGTFNYFENIGSVADPQFASSLLNPFGLESTNHVLPSFVDLDGDEDFDLMVGEYEGVMQYFENIGSAMEPYFAIPQANPFGLESTTTMGANASSWADLDFDGDMDMLTGRNLGTEYFENIGNASDPDFDLPILDPFGIDPTVEWVFTDYVDLNGDGNLDLFLAYYTSSGHTQYYEGPFIPVHVEDNPQSINIKLYPNPTSDLIKVNINPGFNSVVTLNIYNISGSLIKTKLLKQNQQQINVNDLHNGLYILEFKSKEWVEKRKLIIQR